MHGMVVWLLPDKHQQIFATIDKMNGSHKGNKWQCFKIHGQNNLYHAKEIE